MNVCTWIYELDASARLMAATCHTSYLSVDCPGRSPAAEAQQQKPRQSTAFSVQLLWRIARRSVQRYLIVPVWEGRVIGRGRAIGLLSSRSRTQQPFSNAGLRSLESSKLDPETGRRTLLMLRLVQTLVGWTVACLSFEAEPEMLATRN